MAYALTPQPIRWRAVRRRLVPAPPWRRWWHPVHGSGAVAQLHGHHPLQGSVARRVAARNSAIPHFGNGAAGKPGRLPIPAGNPRPRPWTPMPSTSTKIHGCRESPWTNRRAQLENCNAKLENRIGSLTVGAALCRDLVSAGKTCRGINPLLQSRVFSSGAKSAWRLGLHGYGLAEST